MREARWSRAKVDAENRRTGGNIFPAAISSARNERTSRLWPVEHSDALAVLADWIGLDNE